MDAFGDYAVSIWGPNGRAGIVWNGAVGKVGRYAMVAGKGGFWIRDFGERGWVNSIERHGDHIVCRYTIHDEGADADWKKWRGERVPEVTSVAHMVIEVWTFDTPRVLFAHEYAAWAQCCGSEIGLAPPRISDDVTVTPTAIRIRARSAWRVTRASWHETPLAGVEQVIAPWDAPNEIVFPLDGNRRVMASGRADTPVGAGAEAACAL